MIYIYKTLKNEKQKPYFSCPFLIAKNYFETPSQEKNFKKINIFGDF